ncbi:lactonase family protein [Nocardia asiatica]|uniref:lactonase family protein n=1 Tax=Nocardia asiatica TaxID=209252 RepID=UPI003EE0B608
MDKQYFVGAFTSSMFGGEARGISVFERREDGGVGNLVQEVEVEVPSALVVTSGFVFAGTGEGIVAYRREDGRLRRVSVTDSGGIAPCHLRFVADPAGGGAIYVANYYSGTTGRVPVAQDGTLGAVVVAPQPTSPLGPEPARQDGSHTHATEATPWDTVLVTDLGRDRILEYDWQAPDAPALLHEHVMPPNSGPRHVAWSHGRLLVTGELDARLHVLERRDDYLVHIGAIPTGNPDASDERTYPSHIEVHPDGHVAYVGNRSRETLGVFDLAEVAEGGLPRLVQEVPAGGQTPWHFVIDSGRLVLVNMRSHGITTFPILDGGRLGNIDQIVETKSPTCIALA